jgi:class 3 adenylate cyclase/tetratricopeptide (TPR) repeat protein
MGAEPRFRSPDVYTPSHLAEKIRSSRGVVEGERKQVTVLFADTKNSLGLLAHRDPEEARRLLDPLLELMMDAVHRYEGTVNQVMGDGIMALFGAPLALEDHAVRACYAALRMRDAARAYGAGLETVGGAPVQIRIGLNSGEVVVRSIRSDLHMDYTAVGQTIQLAARMEQLATPGAIFATPRTLRLAEGFVQTSSLGPMQVKGMADAVDVFEIAGATGARSRLEASAARGFSRYVGRDAELEQLRRVMARARAGHGQVVAVVGEPGVGKSRLVWELAHSDAAHGWHVVESDAASHGRTTPYFAVVELLKSCFQVESRDTAEQIAGKVDGKLSELGLGDDDIVRSPLRFLLDIPPSESQWQQLDGSARRARILDAVKRLLLRQSHAGPLLVIAENLQAIDTESQAVLDTLVDGLSASRVLFFASYRPEYEHAWAGKSYYMQVRLDPLPADGAAALLQSLLGADPSLTALQQVLIERTQGNPFFLEESVRTLVETGAVDGTRGAYRLAHPDRTVDIPASVQAVLAARIDHLPSIEKELLQAASVIGKDVPFPLLEATAGLPAEDLRRSLAHLRAGEFLYEARLFPDLEYTFKHALTHQVAYQSLLHDRRRALHADIITAMETLYGARRAEHVELLAHHAVRGELWDKAVTYLRQAGAKAIARSAYREAAGCLEQALQTLPHLPHSRTAIEQAIDIRLSLRTSLRPLGELSRVVGYLREAEALAHQLDDRRRLGWVSVWISQAVWVTGHTSEARASGRKATALAEALQDTSLMVVANLVLGLACLTSGDFQEARECFLTMMRLLEGDLSRERFGTTGFPAVQCRAWIAWALGETGGFAEGIAYGREGLEVGESVDDPYSFSIASLSLGMLYAIKGDLEDARDVLERGLRIAGERHVTLQAPRVRGVLGHVLALAGRIAEGEALLDEALSVIESMEQGAFHALLLVRRGEAHLRAGHGKDAQACADRALRLARERGQRGYEAWALRLLGESLSRAEVAKLAGAEAHFHEAMALARALDMKPLVAHCHLGLARLFQHRGDGARATEQRGHAMAAYRELDMGFWVAEAEAGR